MNLNSGWKKLDRKDIFALHMLRPGFELRLVTGETAVFIRRLRKNIAARLNGEEYSIPPASIESYRPGSSDTPVIPKLQESVSVEVDTNESLLHQECKRGDIALFWRGKFDVVKILSLRPLQCQVLDGRGRGKSYRYKETWYVQKLDNERITA